MTRYTVPVPGYDGRLEMEHGGWLSGIRLILDGAPLPTQGRKGLFALPVEGGKPLIGFLRYTFIDPIPSVQVQDQRIRVVPPLRWFEWIVISLPISLIVLDPLIGALIGTFATSLNAQIFRSKLESARKWMAAVGVLAVSFVLFLVIYTATQSLLAG